MLFWQIRQNLTFVFEGEVYIAGGFNGEHCLSSVETYSSSFGQWTLITSLNVPRSGVATIAFKDYIYALGGFDGDRRLSSCGFQDTRPLLSNYETVKFLYNDDDDAGGGDAFSTLRLVQTVFKEA